MEAIGIQLKMIIKKKILMSNLWVTSLQDQKMIDKYILKFCEAIDNFCEGLAKMLEPKIKKKKKKNVK